MPIGIRVAQPARRRAAAALAAVAVAALGLSIALVQNAAASSAASVSSAWAGRPMAAAAAPVTTTGVDAVSLVVDPADGLTAAGATLKITGSGFTTTHGLYVAICRADGKAPATLQECVGGTVPTSNTSNSWAHITSGAAGSGNPGPVLATWGPNGSFSVSIVLPPSNAASDALDCSKVACAIYTTPDAGGDSSQNVALPLVYAAPSTSSTPGSTTPSPPVSSSTPAPTTSSSATISSQPVVTSTIADVPTTVKPKTIRSASVRAGGSQEVLFAGFAKGEVVAVTLDRTPLAAVRADSDGIANISFVVPAGTAAGTHLLRVVGQTSRTTGVASFLVTAAPATTAIASSRAASSSAPAPVPVSSSAPVSSAVVVPPPASSAPLSSSQSPATSGAPAPVVAASSSGTGSRPVWPWYVLGLVVLLWIGFAVFMWQRRRSRLDAEMREKDRILAAGAAAEHERTADAIARANADAPTAYIGPLPTGDPGDGSGYTGYHPGEHGLLSGRDNPDNPGLLSGQQYRTDSTDDLPTTYLPPGLPGSPVPEATTNPQPGAVGPASGGPPTGAWTPDFGGPGAGGPPTGAWTPDFGGPGAGGPPTGAWTPDFTTGPAAAGPDVAGPDAAGPDAAGPEASSHDDGPGTTPGDTGGKHSR